MNSITSITEWTEADYCFECLIMAELERRIFSNISILKALSKTGVSYEGKIRKSTKTEDTKEATDFIKGEVRIQLKTRDSSFKHAMENTASVYEMRLESKKTNKKPTMNITLFMSDKYFSYENAKDLIIEKRITANMMDRYLEGNITNKEFAIITYVKNLLISKIDWEAACTSIYTGWYQEAFYKSSSGDPNVITKPIKDRSCTINYDMKSDIKWKLLDRDSIGYWWIYEDSYTNREHPIIRCICKSYNNAAFIPVKKLADIIYSKHGIDPCDVFIKGL